MATILYPQPAPFSPAVTLPQGGVSGQTGEKGKQTKLSEGGESSKTPFDFNQMMMAWMMNMMNPNVQGAGGAPAVQAAPAQAAQVNPTLGALLQHFGSGATRRTMGGQIEGTPAPDPFTNLNAMRDSQQAHELSKANFAIEREKAREQLGIPRGGYDFGAANRRAMVEGARQRQIDVAAFAASPKGQSEAPVGSNVFHPTTGDLLGTRLGEGAYSLTESGRKWMPQDPFYGMSPDQQQATQAVSGEFDFATPETGGYGSTNVGARYPFLQEIANEGAAARVDALGAIFRDWERGRSPRTNRAGNIGPNNPAVTPLGSFTW